VGAGLVRAAGDEWVGQVYLIQHSAGSGKSNTIAWTAHRLANLHSAKDEKVFDTVIVITDRRVLDRQLQETISQFEHKAGAVQKIDQNSEQLAKALNDGVPVIITTLQKFQFILQKVQGLKDKKFALIVDEAHSSQSGYAAQKLRRALTTDTKKVVTVELDGAPVDVDVDVEIDPEDVTSEDIINQVMLSRQRPPNGHPQVQNARTVRPAWHRRAARAVSRVLHAPGHRGRLHHGRAQAVHVIQDVL
jgi:type I restriction enzyme R subunit